MTRTPEYCGNVSFRVSGDHCPAPNASDLSVAQTCLCGLISLCHSCTPFLHSGILHSRQLSFYTALTDVLKQVSLMLSSHSGSDNLNIPRTHYCVGSNHVRVRSVPTLLGVLLFTRTTAEPQLPLKGCAYYF